VLKNTGEGNGTKIVFDSSVKLYKNLIRYSDTSDNRVGACWSISLHREP